MKTSLHERLHNRHRSKTATIDGHASTRYDFMARHLIRGVYRRIADDIAMAAPHGGEVLDVGTGPGVLLVEIAKRRPDLRLTGVDLSADMVATAERNLGGIGTARIGDAAELPFEDDTFDLIVSSFSLHHWDHPEAAGIELGRVLRPSGRIYLYDFRTAPFEQLDAVGSNQHEMIRASWLFPRFARHVITTAATTA
jgi:ubiquinone/menaquinone biosynthesis C-methylase UbiE